MDNRISPSEALRGSIQYWNDFISKCLTKRLDAGPFEDYVKLVFAKHQLTPDIIADFFLQPQKSNCVSPDPRIPPYISVLTQLRYIDAASILRALYRYSSLHSLTPQQAQESAKEQGQDQEQAQAQQDGETKKHRRSSSQTLWKSSSWLEEVMFYHVIRLVVEGTALKDSRTALELMHIISKWMSLFSAASNPPLGADMLAGGLQDPQVRHEMEVSRAAFVPLLLRLVDNPALVKAISHPAVKGNITAYPLRSLHLLTILCRAPKAVLRESYIFCANLSTCPAVR